MVAVRPPAVAGRFYPADAAGLRRAIDAAYGGARVTPPSTTSLSALIAPHAGYVYSGAVAASAYRMLPACDRVVLLGPSHFVPVNGLAVSAVDAFATPFGAVRVDNELRETALTHPAVAADDAPHVGEHSLEVHLPFLQQRLGTFTLLPLAVGRVPKSDVAGVLRLVVRNAGTVVVLSTDLSHYQDDFTARTLDRRTADAVVGVRADDISDTDACGAYPLRGLLTWARDAAMSVTLLDLRTSGEAAGDRSRVVGYGAFAVHAGPDD